MRLAFVTSLLPTARLAAGPAMADACIAEALAHAGCDIRMFGFLRDEDPEDPPGEAVLLARRPARGPAGSLLRQVGSLTESARLGLPTAAARLATADSGALRAAIAQEGPFDGCVVSGADVAAAFPWLFDRFPALFVAHEVGHVAARAGPPGAGLLDGALRRRDSKLLQKSERTALEAASFVWCLAEEDRGVFGAGIAGKSAVLPLLAPLRPPLESGEPMADVGLIGNWACGQASQGLRWFLESVAPLLPDDISVAVGGDLPRGLHGLGRRVQLAGDAPDRGAFIASCRCMALTSRSRTGVTAETVDVLQFGMPAVATRASVRGIGWLPTNCLVADEPKAYAAALAKLVRDLRSERSAPTDGSAFVEAQQRGLRNGIAVGLAALRGGRAAR